MKRITNYKNIESIDDVLMGEGDGASISLECKHYYLSHGLKLRNLKNITIESETNSVISSEKRLDNKRFEHYRDNIYKYDLKKAGIFDYGALHNRGFRRPYVNTPTKLICNGTPMKLSRYPKNNEIAIEKVLYEGSVPRTGDYENKGGIIGYSDSRIDNWAEEDDIWICGNFATGYADDCIKIKRIDTKNKTIELCSAHMYGIKSGNEWNKFYALNVFCEMNEEGEYYIDRENGILYACLPRNYMDFEYTLTSMDEPMISIIDCENITIRNITLCGGRGIGIYIEGGQNVTVDKCTINNVGIVGVCIGKGVNADKIYRHNFTGEPASEELGSWHEHIYDNTAYNRKAGKNHTISGCHIYNTGAGGISMGGGDRKTLIPANNKVINCEIHDCNRWDKFYKANINIDGVGNYISGCHLYNAPGSAVYLHGNNHIIEYNEIHDVCIGADDMGAFYMGRDPSERGNIIRCNYFHHIPIVKYPKSLFKDGQGTYSIYNDDGACGTQILNNVFYDAGYFTILNNGGNDIKIEGNLFIKSYVAIYHSNSQANKYNEQNRPKEDSLLYKRIYKSVDIMSDVYILQYPELKYFLSDEGKPNRNTAIENTVVKCPNFLMTRYNEDYLVDKDDTAWYEQSGNEVTWDDKRSNEEYAYKVFEKKCKKRKNL